MAAGHSTEVAAEGFRLPVAGWSAIWLAFWVGLAAALHQANHGVVNGFHLLLALFLAINLLICVWEICLLLRIDVIEERHRRRQEAVSGERRPRRRSFFLAPVPLRELFSATLWSRVWSEYALYDPSYADRKSFGFAIDVGNGVSTLLPSLVFLLGMSFSILSPVMLGIVGLLIFYQKFYGTLLYFFTYVFNERYRGQRRANVFVFVGAINGIWVLFPAIGLYVCARLILDASFDVIRG